MITLTGMKQGANNSAQITAFADNKADVGGSMSIIGLPEGLTLSMGSAIFTAAGEVAFLKSDGTWNWVANAGGGGGGASSLAELDDVDTSAAGNGKVLKYNGTSEKWEAATDEGQSTFAGLTDTSISNPSDGQVATYNSTSGKWENKAVPTELPDPTLSENYVLSCRQGEWKGEYLSDIIAQDIYNNEGFLFYGPSGTYLTSGNLLDLLNQYTYEALGTYGAEAGDIIYFNGDEWVIGNPNSQE